MPWNCCICGVFAADNITGLLNHIGRCHRNEPNFHCVCGIDGCAKTFRKYYTWRKHITDKHFNVYNANNDKRPQSDYPNLDNAQPDPVQNLDSPVDRASINAEEDEVMKSSALYILKLQEECCLPKSTVKSVIANTKSVIRETISAVQKQVQERLEANNIDFYSIAGLKECFDDDNFATNPFNKLETEAQQMAYYKDQFQLKEPKRIFLGQKEIFRRRRGVLQPTQSKDECYYVSILDSLQQLLNDEFILEEVHTPHRSTDGILRDYCDGEKFKNHPLFSTDHNALQIFLYYDDLETCNPLGSRSTKHKLGAFYYTIGNVRPLYRSSLKAIQLLCLCKTAIIKKYGIDEVLRPFMTDLKELEKGEGHPFLIKGTVQRYRGSIAYASGDNLGSQLLGGFKESCSAHCTCRHCLGVQAEIRTMFHEKYFTLRKKESHENHCYQVLAYGEHYSKTYGINRRPILNESRFFNVIGGLPTDAMHDILEGVLHYEIKEMLKDFIKVQSFFTLENLNGRLAKFDFGYYNDTNRPSPIPEQKLSSNDNNLKQHAVQMWCLAIHLPLVIGDWIPSDNEKWLLFLKLLEITSICLSPEVSQQQIAYLQVLIEDHHIQFCNLYPQCTIIPKMHFMIHMPGVIMSLGPLLRSWCMRYEAKHHYFKKLSTIIGNFTNLPYTMAMRHQQWMCYKLNTTGNYESSFIEKGVDVGPGSTVCAGDLVYYDALKQKHGEVDQTTNVTRPKWISVHGTKFKTKCVVWNGHDEEEMPVFSLMKEICVVGQNLKDIWMVTEKLQTICLNQHFNAFEVQVEPNQELVLLKQSDLSYGFPLHLITIPADEEELDKTFVCPKFQLPAAN